MSSSLLYHTFGIRGYEYESTQQYEGETFFWVTLSREQWRCAACSSDQVIGHGHTVRQLHIVPVGGRRCWVVVRLPRVECKACGRTRQLEVPAARPRCSYTKPFERYVQDLCRWATMLDVARHLGVGWDLVKEIRTRDLRRRFARPKLKHLRRIAIDEIHIGHGGRYLTLVLDLDSGRVVHVADGKGGNALKSFWKRLKASHARVQAVAMDMSWAYAAAVRDHLPNATIVYDHFHLIKLFNEKLSQLRRDVQREATEQLHKKVLKGIAWLLLKNPENLCEKRRERERLDDALRLNSPLTMAYYMRDDLRQLWQQPDLAAARLVFDDWVRRAEASGVRMLQQFAKTMRIHRAGILAWYHHPISTGPLEGTNNKIRTVQRQAYGFRDPAFLKLRILGLHEARVELLG